MEAATKAATLTKAPVPEDAPAFFTAAFERARKSNRPLVVDFWATWCAPCVKLKQETLGNQAVAKALTEFEVVYVDLEHHPSLAKAYGVSTVPDVFLVDREGFVYDRLRKFEAAAAFLPRLRREASRRFIDLSICSSKLRQAFNAAKGKVRIVAILSPG